MYNTNVVSSFEINYWRRTRARSVLRDTYYYTFLRYWYSAAELRMVTYEDSILYPKLVFCKMSTTRDLCVFIIYITIGWPRWAPENRLCV